MILDMGIVAVMTNTPLETDGVNLYKHVLQDIMNQEEILDFVVLMEQLKGMVDVILHRT